MYDNARIALRDLQDPNVLERVAFHVLRPRYPDLQLTAATGDTGADAYVRRLFSNKDDLRVMVSLEENWRKKLDAEIAKIRTQKPKDRAPRALFVTSQNATEIGKKPREQAARRLKVDLEIVGLAQLVSELETDALRWVAEFELGVRAAAPRALIGPDEFLSQMGEVIPGFEADLVGRDDEMKSIAEAIAATGKNAPRVIVVNGPGGIGKSRIAVEAAQRAATTLVAPARVAVDRAALTEVPVMTPAVIVVDDAHRSPDLSGLAAMLGNAKYNGVKVVLTTRAGLAEAALEQAGLDAHPRLDVPLEVLDRPDVAEIVRGHGLHDDGFTVAVIDIAQGSPLLAHLACDVAVRTGRFHWRNATDVLRDGVARRLGGLGSGARAVAIALALTGPVEGGAELAHLARVVRLLPDDRNDLDRLLDDVADAGLASITRSRYQSGVVYALRPELFAPVLVADALNPTDPNRIDRTAALESVGAGHGDGPVGMLGLPPVAADGTAFDVARVAPRLLVLAQAAALANDTALADRVGRGVLELLPDPATAAAMRSVVVLAEQVAHVAPQVFDSLAAALRQQWPLPPAPPSPYFDDPGREQALDLEQLVQAVEGLVTRAGSAAPRAAIKLALTTAALASPSIDVDRRGPRRAALESTRAVTAWGGGRYATGDEMFANRDTAVDAIKDWMRHDTAGLQPSVAAHVAISAITPLIKPTVQAQWMSTPEAADVLVMSSGWLADDPRTRTGCLTAADVTAELIASLDLSDPIAGPVLREVVRLPAELVAEGRRGIPNSTTATPRHVTTTLAAAAGRIRAAVSTRWADLPLWARHAAASADSIYGPRPPTLAQRAVRGDPVAEAALADAQLQDLLVLTSIGRVGPSSMQGPAWARHVAAREVNARALAGRVDWATAVQLLEVASDIHGRDFADSEAQAAFANEVGRRAGAEGHGVALTDALASATGRWWERQVLLGVVETAPEIVAVLTGRRRRPAITLLAISIANDLPAGSRHAIFDGAHRLAAGGRPGWRQQAVALARRLTGRGATQGADPTAADAARRLARALLRGPDAPTERMDRLLALGLEAPAEAVPEILQLGTYAIRTDVHRSGGAPAAPAADPELVTASSAQGAVLVRLLARRLDELKAGLGADHETAMAVAALAAAVPEELAAELAPRLASSTWRASWPIGWDQDLRELPAAARAPFVQALRARLDAVLAATPVDDVTRFDLDRAVAAVAAGTDEWVAEVEAWADGDAASRARAVASVARVWRHPVWPSVVARLLTRGVDDRQTSELLHGIEITSFGPDIAKQAGTPRLAALDRLAQTSQDPAVARFVADARGLVNGALEDYDNDTVRRRRGYGR